MGYNAREHRCNFLIVVFLLKKICGVVEKMVVFFLSCFAGYTEQGKIIKNNKKNDLKILLILNDIW